MHWLKDSQTTKSCPGDPGNDKEKSDEADADRSKKSDEHGNDAKEDKRRALSEDFQVND